jgi:hypothetical protein
VLNIRACAFIAVAAFILSLLIGIFTRSAMPLLILRPVLFACLFFALSLIIMQLVSRYLPELLEEGFSSDASFLPGSHIDITEGGDPSSLTPGNFSSDSETQPSFMGAQPDSSDDSIGHISDLAAKIASRFESTGNNLQSTGIDANSQSGYNEKGALASSGDLEAMPEAADFMPWEPLPLSGGFGGQVANEDRREPAAASAAPSMPSFESKAGAQASQSSFSGFADLDSMAGAFSFSASERGSETGGYSSPSKRSKAQKEASWAEDFNAKQMAEGIRTALKKDKEG